MVAAELVTSVWPVLLVGLMERAHSLLGRVKHNFEDSMAQKKAHMRAIGSGAPSFAWCSCSTDIVMRLGPTN